MLRAVALLSVLALIFTAAFPAVAAEPSSEAKSGKCGLIMEAVFSLASPAGKTDEAKNEKYMLWLRNKAQSGVASDQQLLGMLYFIGNGTEKNEEEGLRWLRKSAEQGYIPAQDLLSLLYQNCAYLRNDAEAVKWTKRAAQQGDPMAQQTLAQFYHDATGGLKRDDIEAEKWYILASKDQAIDPVLLSRKMLELTMPDKDIATARQKAAAWNPKLEITPLKLHEQECQ